jgi:hypothetical protein
MILSTSHFSRYGASTFSGGVLEHLIFRAGLLFDYFMKMKASF